MVREPPVFIANPNAGAGCVGRRWSKISKYVHARFPHSRTLMTEGVGHGTTIAHELVSNGVETIYIIGGDGTTNEVVDGVMKAVPDHTVTLGQIPVGTGGDFYRVLDSPDNLNHAIDALVDAPAFPCDVGRIEFTGNDGAPAVRHFLNIASVGIGGVVDTIVNETPKWLGGKSSFYLGTVRALLQYDSTHCEIRVDGKHIGEHRVTGVFIANSRYAGGSMKIAPHALLDDGLFDIVIIPKLGLLESLSSLRSIYKGTHLERDDVLYTRGRSVEVSPVGGSEGLLDVDGEPPGEIPAIFTIEPAAIRFANLGVEVRDTGE